ncbi:MAG TPA: S8 family peptidase [Thermoanaerobaculia bacterium]|nr:S8 family peptidase [Thermoanaerobaculia bacterium]
MAKSPPKKPAVDPTESPKRSPKPARLGSPGRFFDPRNLDRTVIALPLLEEFEKEKAGAAATPLKLYPVIIDLNLDYPGGRQKARAAVKRWVAEAVKRLRPESRQGIDKVKSDLSNQYFFASLEREVIEELVRINGGQGLPAKAAAHAIYHIWPDFAIKALLIRSVPTIKADAARISFSAQGKDIIWAVLDSGIQKDHPHFAAHKNLDLPKPLEHRDFTALSSAGKPLEDRFGHGTHVAGIIAGEITPERAKKGDIEYVTRRRKENGEIDYVRVPLPTGISGVAPQCKLISFKVLDDDGNGQASSLIAALTVIQEINGYGRRIRIHGVNMSVGYEFDPEWFACGQSPLCVEVDRLVRSGVVVVVAAGNTGYGSVQSAARGAVTAGIGLTINDPGNADKAITVGATHRDMPHVYGVSYFSSKGPTGDGRSKPDVVAPGEKIVSCAVGAPLEALAEGGFAQCDYREESGTSMAAPHVSGAIAAFLSIRSEFVGRPEEVKQIFLSTATDLKREKYFQGNGLVDLMRAIQSV